MVIGTYISIITLNINGLNAPTKRHRLAEWIQKQDPYICCVQETHFRPRDTYRLKVRGWKKRHVLIIQRVESQYKSCVKILNLVLLLGQPLNVLSLECNLLSMDLHESIMRN